MLIAEANGFSLEPLYERIPEILKGYVELTYDLNNYPAIRFIEGLSYKSSLYREWSQSLALSLCERDERPFALSSPALLSSVVKNERHNSASLPLRLNIS